MNAQQIFDIIKMHTPGRKFEVRSLNISGKLYIFFPQTDAFQSQLQINSAEAEWGDDADVSFGMLDYISSPVFGGTVS